MSRINSSTNVFLGVLIVIDVNSFNDIITRQLMVVYRINPQIMIDVNNVTNIGTTSGIRRSNNSHQLQSNRLFPRNPSSKNGVRNCKTGGVFATKTREH
jgi:hypothetical protein